MNRRFAAFTVLAALALGFLLVRTDTAEATSAHKNSFNSAYPNAANTRLDSCSTCHTSAPDLNSYGADLKAAGISFSAIALKDSDGDGANNQDEIRALTFPGNASDKPVTTITTVATTTPTTAPSTTVSTTATTTASTTVTTTPSALSLTSATSESTALIFPMTYDLGEAGTVTIDLVDGALFATVDAADGWDFDIEYEDDEVEVELRNGETEIEIEAEFEDGQVKVKIETENDDDGDDRRGHDDDDGDDDGRGHENHDEDEKRGRGHHDDDDDDDDDDD